MGKLLRNLLVLGAMISVAPVAAHQRPLAAQHEAAASQGHDPSTCPFARAKAEAAARAKAEMAARHRVVAFAIMHSKAPAPAEGSFLEVRSEAPGLLP